MHVFSIVSISSLLMNLYISNQKTDNRYDIKKTFSPVGIEVVDCEAVLYLFICIAWSNLLMKDVNSIYIWDKRKGEHLSEIYSAPWSIPPWWWAHCWVCRRPWKSGPLECRRSSWRRCGGTLWTCSCSFCRSPQCAPGTAQTGTKPQTNQIKRQIRIDNIFSSNLDLWQSEVSSLGKSRTHLLLLLLCQQTHLRTFLWRCCCFFSFSKDSVTSVLIF